MLRPGTNLGPFTVEQELGRGGMGVVFRARDTRLDRPVAIKAMPAHLEADPDRLARFQREAKLLAALNHPNIGAIYGLEESDSHRYLVLEFIEGETLADRLKSGPIPIDEALTMARQIAEALEAAHEKGIVHRDLKPGNVMITSDGVVKVLDFGLARTADGSASTSNVKADSPTVTTPPAHSPTIAGVIMGTAGYMSPEQARGKPVDKRSDIFSFGCVLYEMLTGIGPFPGETTNDSIGAILHREPDWSALPPGVSARIRELLTTCLTKDRKQRLHDIGDARLLLERHADPEPVVPAAARSARETVAWLAAAAGLAVAIGVWFVRPTPTVVAEKPRLLQFAIPAPPGTELNAEAVNSAISPNGRQIAFIAGARGSVSKIWIHDFDSLNARPLEGTDGASLPFWSPDGQSVAYFANGALFRIAAAGGPAQRLADAPGPRGGDWGETGVILFAPTPNGPLHVVPQSGGGATVAVELDASSNETGQRFPQFLPGGKRFLYASMAMQRRENVWLEFTRFGSLDSPKTQPVCSAGGRATFVPGGWLLLDRSGSVYAQKFDPETGTVSGDEIATPIRNSPDSNYTGSYSVTSSRSGVVACVVNGRTKSDCFEIGPDGQIVRKISAAPDFVNNPQASPTGEHVALLTNSNWSTSNIMMVDLVRGISKRVTDDFNTAGICWSADGRWLYFSSDKVSRDIYRLEIAGSRKPELVYVTKNLWSVPVDATADGKTVIFSQLDPKTQRDLWIWDATTQTAKPLSAELPNEFGAKLSPDQRLVAIASDESGKEELYVQSYLDPGVRVRVSLSGIYSRNSGAPTESVFRWSSDGSSIFFLDADRRTIYSAPVTEKPSLRVGKPEKVIRLAAPSEWVDIGPDGKSAFVVMPAEGQAERAIAVTMNWIDQLAAAANSKK